MASFHWIKLYQDILNDPKMGRLSDSAFRRCIELFLMAGQADERDGRLPARADIAWALRIDEAQLDTDWAELEKAGIVAEVNGVPFVVNFAKRQEALSSTERSRKSRKRNAGKPANPHPQNEKRPERPQPAAVSSPPDEPKGNESEPQSQHDCSDNATFRCTDIDIDKDQEHICARAREGVPEPVWAVITELSKVTKTTYWEITADDFENAAYALIGLDATLEQIRGFPAWWRDNSWYDDDSLPQLKHVVDSWKSYTSGVTKRPSPAGTNGRAANPQASSAWAEVRREVARPGKPQFDDPLVLPTIQAIPGGWHRFKTSDMRFLDRDLKEEFVDAYTRQQRPLAVAQ